MTHILTVEDNPQMQKLVTVNLQARGYTVKAASSGEEVLDIFAVGKFDLVLLDLILPGISGIDVCIWIRHQSDVPIVVLSAREDEELKVRALDAGADDYVTKPFSQEEMMARVRAVLRRAGVNNSEKKNEVRVKDLLVNFQAHRAFLNGDDMHLTRTEFAILSELVKNQEAVLSHDDLLTRVWGPEFRGSSHYLHIYLGRIRKKLGVEMDQLLETVPGIGYILHSGA